MQLLGNAPKCRGLISKLLRRASNDGSAQITWPSSSRLRDVRAAEHYRVLVVAGASTLQPASQLRALVDEEALRLLHQHTVLVLEAERAAVAVHDLVQAIGDELGDLRLAERCRRQRVLCHTESSSCSLKS